MLVIAARTEQAFLAAHVFCQQISQEHAAKNSKHKEKVNSILFSFIIQMFAASWTRETGLACLAKNKREG